MDQAPMIQISDLIKIVVPVLVAIVATNGALIKVIHWMLSKSPERKTDTNPDLHVCSHHYEMVQDVSSVKGSMDKLASVTNIRLKSIEGSLNEVKTDVRDLVDSQIRTRAK